MRRFVSTSSTGRLEERVARAIGEHDARVGDVQGRPALREVRALRPNLVLVEQPVRHAALVERTRRGERGVRDELDQPVEAEEAGIELLPPRVRLLREANPVRLGIRHTEDPRAPVARAAVVVELELLVHRHLGAALAQRPRGRAAHHPRADDCDLQRTIRSPG
jgi:hypothetical protein